MNRERFQQVAAIFEQAIGLEGSERSAMVERACGDDDGAETTEATTATMANIGIGIRVASRVTSTALPPLAAVSRKSITAPIENAMASSPESASTWNSCERLPPIAPLSACTGRKSMPSRVKMRV